MTNEAKKQSKAPQTKSEAKVAVKKNTEANIKKAALKKDLEAQKKAALENLKKKQEATEKQFLARVNNMASSFETVNGWLESKRLLSEVLEHTKYGQEIAFADAANIACRTVELLHGIAERFEAIESVEEYKDFFDSMIDHKFNEQDETTIMDIAMEAVMLNIARTLDGQLQEAYHFNEDAKEAIAKLDEQISKAE